MLKLYSISGSPFAWRVSLALEHKRVPYEVAYLSMRLDTSKPEFLAVNPRGQVPAIDDDGFHLHEAAAIVEYIEERWPDAPPLFPRHLHARAKCRELIREIDEYIAPFQFRLARQLFFKPEPEWDHAEVTAMRDQLVAEVPYLERALTGDYLFGSLSAADQALYTIFAVWRRFTRKMPTIGLEDAWGPNIRAWMSRFEALPYFDRTYPPHWRE